MNLADAILHALDADNEERVALSTKDHLQIAAWLAELRDRRAAALSRHFFPDSPFSQDLPLINPLKQREALDPDAMASLELYRYVSENHSCSDLVSACMDTIVVDNHDGTVSCYQSAITDDGTVELSSYSMSKDVFKQMVNSVVHTDKPTHIKFGDTIPTQH